MAKPLPIVIKPSEISKGNDVREELQRKLAEAPLAHAEALLSLYELAQTLHDRGVFDLLRGLAGAGDDIADRISSALGAPETVRSIRNMIALAQLVGNIDPKILESLRGAASDTVKKDDEANRKAPGLWAIIRRADSEDSLRALAAFTDFLESFGRRLKTNSSESNSKS